MTVLRGGRVVTPEGILDDGWLAVEDGRIAAIGSGPSPSDAIDLGGAWLLPGFIDLHVHGGGGHDMTESPEEMAAAVAFHRQHGTTRTLVSLITAPQNALVEQLGWVADIVAAGPNAVGHVVGVHLEGPFLSRARCGAQNPKHLLMPEREIFARLVDAARCGASPSLPNCPARSNS